MRFTHAISEQSDLLLRLWSHLSLTRRKQFLKLSILMLLSALSEVMSLGAVLPFLSVLISPELIFNYPFVRTIAEIFGFSSADKLILPLSIIFVFLAFLAGTFRMLFLWVSTRVVFSTGADISIEVYKRSLYQPYQTHLSRNSSEIISGITNKVNGVVFGVLQTSLILVSSIVLLLAIIFALFIIDPTIASITTLGFGISYGCVTLISRRSLNQNSQLIAREEVLVIKALQEGLGGIRDVLLDNTQKIYCDIYQKADQPLRRAMGNNVFIAGSPRYIMEFLGIALITMLAYSLSYKNGGVSDTLPILGALALGAQRLLPALQNIYSSWASIAGSKSSLIDLLKLLELPIASELTDRQSSPIAFEKSIRFKNVKFRYDSQSSYVLNEIDLTIPKGAKVGVIGSTGSGKSTMLDLLMGLLEPTEGQILVDDLPITREIYRPWQQMLAHVPQNIYLADITIAENIAFGVPMANIDMDRVKQAASQAQISDYIESSLDGYFALVGERGVRLSGGQRQRIGIARALYKQASILVFDEATSALDNSTEQSVMKAIEDLSRVYTVIIVAHRLSTVKHCDIIIELENGSVIAQKTYDEILECGISVGK